MAALLDAEAEGVVGGRGGPMGALVGDVLFASGLLRLGRTMGARRSSFCVPPEPGRFILRGQMVKM